MLDDLEFSPRSFPEGRFTLIDRAGAAHVLPGVAGLSLMEILRAGGFAVAATCGGAAACGTCHVYVEPGFLARLAPLSEAEQWQLEHLVLVRPNSRLSCQIVWHQALLDGLVLTLAPVE